MNRISTKRIKVTSECNQDCIFCDSNAELNPNLYSEERIMPLISKRGDLKRLNITGGEPTVSKNFEKFVRLARRSGYEKIAVLTNGNNFEDYQFVSKIKKAGLTEAIVSAYHYDSKISDKISRLRGSFLRKKEGIKNLQKMGVKVTINIVIYRGNQFIIQKLVEYFHKSFGIKSFALSFLETNCKNVARNPALIPNLEEGMAELKNTVEYCEKNRLKYLIPYHGAIPICIFETQKIKVLKPESVIGEDFDSSRIRISFCQNCKEKKYCKGFLKKYALGGINILSKMRK